MILSFSGVFLLLSEEGKVDFLVYFLTHFGLVDQIGFLALRHQHCRLLPVQSGNHACSQSPE